MYFHLGTRGSALALCQADIVKNKLSAASPTPIIEIVPIKTSGDTIKDIKPFGGKGLFVKELEEALLDGRIDAAVHSMKDVPAEIPGKLIIAACLKRGDPRDAFVSKKYADLSKLPCGAKVGTSSPRRTSHALALRPDVVCVPVRGNVETRLKKLQRGECDAIILAAAGLKRLGLQDQITTYLDDFVPAIGQAVIGIEMCTAYKFHKFVKEACNDPATEAAVIAEREFLKTVGGDCHTPIAAYAEVCGGKLVLTGWVGSPDGRRTMRDVLEGDVNAPAELGRRLGEIFVNKGAREIINSKH